MIRRPPRSTLFPTRRSSDLRERQTKETHVVACRARSSDVGSIPTASTIPRFARAGGGAGHRSSAVRLRLTDRKSTRLNSSHSQISYAVFCLKKKNKQNK